MPDVAPDNTRNEDWDTRFIKLDNYFVMFIKAMSAKILAVLGLYTIFNKPKMAELARYNISMSPIRTILGGSKTYSNSRCTRNSMYVSLFFWSGTKKP